MMAANSFVVFNDNAAFDELDDAQLGRLFRAMIQHSKGDAVSLDKADPSYWVFATIRKQMDMRAANYEERCEKNRENGQKGGIATATKRKQSLPKASDGKRNVADASLPYPLPSPSPSPSPEPESPYTSEGCRTSAEITRSIIDHLNEATGCSYKANSSDSSRHINARLSEGFTEKDFFTVIDKKAAEWKGTEFEKYLRPSTLFGTKFESYLNAKTALKGGVKNEQLAEYNGQF